MGTVGPRVSVSATPVSQTVSAPVRSTATSTPTPPTTVSRAEYMSALKSRQDMTKFLSLTDTDLKLKALRESGGQTTAKAINDNVQSGAARFFKALGKTLGGVINNVFKYGVSFPIKFALGVVELTVRGLGNLFTGGRAFDKTIAFSLAEGWQKHIADNRLSDFLTGKNDASSGAGDGTLDVGLHLLDKDKKAGDRLTDLSSQIYAPGALDAYRELPESLAAFRGNPEFDRLFSMYHEGSIDDNRLKGIIDNSNLEQGQKQELYDHMSGVKHKSFWDADAQVTDPDAGDIIGIVSSSVGIVKAGDDLMSGMSMIQKGRDLGQNAKGQIAAIDERIKEINTALEQPNPVDPDALKTEKALLVRDRERLEQQQALETTLASQLKTKGSAKTAMSLLSMGQSIMTFGKFAADGFRQAGHVFGKVIEPVMSGINAIRDGHSIHQNSKRLDRLQAFAKSDDPHEQIEKFFKAKLKTSEDKLSKVSDALTEVTKEPGGELKKAKDALSQAETALADAVRLHAAAVQGQAASPPTATADDVTRLKGVMDKATEKVTECKVSVAKAENKRDDLTTQKNMLTEQVAALTEKVTKAGSVMQDGSVAALDAVELMRKNQTQAKKNKWCSCAINVLKFVASTVALAMAGAAIAGLAVTPVGWIVAGAGLAVALGMGIYQVYKNDRRSEHVAALKEVNNKLPELRTELTAKTDALKDQKRDLRSLISASDTDDIAAKSAAYKQTQEQAISDAEDVIQTKKDSIETNKGTISANTARIAQLQQELDALPGQISAQEAVVRGLGPSPDPMHPEVIKLGQLTGSQTDKSQEKTRLGDDNTRLGRENTTLTADIATEQGKIDTANQNLTKLKEQSALIEQTEKEIKGLENTIASAPGYLAQTDPETAAKNLIAAFRERSADGKPTASAVEAEYVLREIFHLDPAPFEMATVAQKKTTGDGYEQVADKPKFGEELAKAAEKQLTAKLGMFYTASSGGQYD